MISKKHLEAVIQTGRNNFIDLSGQKYGLLTVIKLSEHKQKSSGRGSETIWECLCDCGNITKVYSQNIKRGLTKSCGCLFKKRMKGKSHPNWRNDLSSLHGNTRNV
jgi:hypothetical protein